MKTIISIGIIICIIIIINGCSKHESITSVNNINITQNNNINYQKTQEISLVKIKNNKTVLNV